MALGIPELFGSLFSTDIDYPKLRSYPPTKVWVAAGRGSGGSLPLEKCCLETQGVIAGSIRQYSYSYESCPVLRLVGRVS